ncbi:alpha/beta hydrolase [Echinicola sp. CAU 1574]|uniref:Alpha/beta hydrolase n=1 Tax=Echinicola arenosa TaxID=2774144 RepID=A0ABR9AFI9_9BACT|nr:alpha/beta hydrolase [Echinicola arenosa]MBD8487463.1 alpha/beta hydrolase [Echinicola arenosa]
MFKKLLPFLLSIAIILVIVYMLGPKESYSTLEGTYPQVPTNLEQLESYVFQKEDTVKGLKPNNEARIVWADSLNKTKTPYSVVYIHGFGASQMEGSPVHQKLAEHFGANLYLARLPEHGIKRDNTFEYLTAEKLADGAREALMIGKSLGDEVIVVGTSMGGALTVLLASEREDIKSILLYSPCIRDYGNQLEAFFSPWQGWLFEKFGTNEDQVVLNPREGDKAKYWSEEYHINSYISLAKLVYSKMNEETFKKIKQPLFLGYYYKDEQHQDNVVSVPAMLDMFEKVSTPENLKEKVAFPEANDHVIGSSITSGQWQEVLEASIDFLENKVKIPAAEKVEQAL